jgi:hypothetical protein
MVTAMLLAHLVGDYLLQWDRLAFWKSREVKGAVVHGLIVTLVTLAFAALFDWRWWPWALFIGLTHIAIDAIQPLLGRRVPLQGPGLFGLTRLLIDQVVHLSVIAIALLASGYLTLPSLAADVLAAFQSHRGLTFALGYVFIAMPAWILVEFTVYGLVMGSAPDFSQATQYKYVGTLERWLIATFVVLGQFGLVPLVALPRLVLEGPQVIGTRRAMLYVAELLASVMLAVIIGLGLRQL